MYPEFSLHLRHSGRWTPTGSERLSLHTSRLTLTVGFPFRGCMLRSDLWYRPQQLSAAMRSVFAPHSFLVASGDFSPGKNLLYKTGFSADREENHKSFIPLLLLMSGRFHLPVKSSAVRFSLFVIMGNLLSFGNTTEFGISAVVPGGNRRLHTLQV